MISLILADVEKQFIELLSGENLALDAVLEYGDKGDLKTVFVSTEYDPSVGIYGGWVFTLWWRYEYDEKEEGMRLRIVREDWGWGGVGQGRKRWGVPDDWQDVYELILENKGIVERALVRLEM